MRHPTFPVSSLRFCAAATAVAVGLLCLGQPMAAVDVRIPRSAKNLLVGAKLSGNLESYRKGIRGASDHMIYDLQQRRFVKSSQWHEYGVGYGQSLGIVPEEHPAWWMAEWPKLVEANLIVFSGVYPNQPQPETCWKIELHRNGSWSTHARGTGGWYNTGRYVWGGPGTEPIRFDAIRVSAFSKDEKSPLKSIHFRGEEGVSWVVCRCSPIDARIQPPRPPLRSGQPLRFAAEPLAGHITSWRWRFGDGQTSSGQHTTHTFAKPGPYEIALVFSDGNHVEEECCGIAVAPPIEATITPLNEPIMAGQPVIFAGDKSFGTINSYAWDFGDGQSATGGEVSHIFAKQGIYKVKLTVSDGEFSDHCLAIVRAHTRDTLHVPQVLLDTDQKNEQDDQHYLGYAVFSELDLLGVNSVHHGGGQEPINYEEILHVLDLAIKSGLPSQRVPFVFRGANQRLKPPRSRVWYDTIPYVTDASNAILAAARGASPSNPVWVVPVGPGTNVACAILQARQKGLELKNRMRVAWLGGSHDSNTGEFNGNNDPWSIYVVAHSGVPTLIVPAYVGAQVAIDKRTEGHLYADHPLGQYLKTIVPARNKPLFDPSALSAIISDRLGLGWVKQKEPITIAGPKQGYRWTKTDQHASVYVIRQINQEAMKADIFNTMKGRPTRLIGEPPR